MATSLTSSECDAIRRLGTAALTEKKGRLANPPVVLFVNADTPKDQASCIDYSAIMSIILFESGQLTRAKNGSWVC
jgi:hypothetical protein